MFLNIFKGIGISLLLVIFVFAGYLYFWGPSFPEGTDVILDQAIEAEAPILLKGLPGYVKNDGVTIWYESIKPKTASKGVILLIMGITGDAYAWPDYFVNTLVDQGYEVIRYDNRDTGMSDWLEDLDRPYSLSDMGNDAIAILDSLDHRQVHLVGMSMGGMIAQDISIRHPERVKTLTSIMSSAYIGDPDMPPIPDDILRQLGKVGLKYGLLPGEKSRIKASLGIFTILKNQEFTLPEVEHMTKNMIYRLRNRPKFNINSISQHSDAIIISGSRYEPLSQLDIPTLVIHGYNDPLINIAHGKKTAEIIPAADTLWIEGMGHYIPYEHTPLIANHILEMIERTKENATGGSN